MSISRLQNEQTPRVVQSYGIDSLVDTSLHVVDVREFFYRKGRGSRPTWKQVQHFPAAPETESGTGILSNADFNRLYGQRASAIRNLLVNKNFCRLEKSEKCLLTWRFRNMTVEDFDVGLGSKANSDIFRSLEILLWQPMPTGDGVDRFIKSLESTSEDVVQSIYRITDHEYWFRQGINIIAIRFDDVPSPELLSLIDHKLQVIQQEKMQNYFHIISTFNADSEVWMNEKNRSGRFFEIIEHLLMYTWRPFDMKTCEVSIDAAGDEGLIASGTLCIDFAENGAASTRFDMMDRRFNAAGSQTIEFVVNEVSLRAANLSGESSFLSMHMVSRSPGNVDPRGNILTHRFVKLFIESVGKLIDVIMPVIRREEALNNLRWRYFLDSTRLRALEYGEDLHLIVSDSLDILRRLFGIKGVLVFSEDEELANMLRLFSRGDAKPHNYRMLDGPLTPEEILRKQVLVFPVREIQNGRVLLYFDLPGFGPKPSNPEQPDQYLMGTDLWTGVNEEAAVLNLSETKDFLFFLVTECLTANPKAVVANVNRRLPVRGDVVDIDIFLKLCHRILQRFSRFFDLFQTLSGNLESGLAYLRGRRDNLTGLYNRQHFKDMLNNLFLQPGSKLGLIFIDMDNFKIFNDAVSHDFGDRLLRSLAQRLIESTEFFKFQSVPGRFGGDEFCYFIDKIEPEDFEQKAADVFLHITGVPLDVDFFIEDRTEHERMEINLISFLHRLMRPDIGSRQASKNEYVEPPNTRPKAHVVRIWKYLRRQRLGEEETSGVTVQAEQIISDISATIEDKILYNQIFPEIDEQFSRIIRLFIAFQMKNCTTNVIR
ncbi:MAG: GGDEF domain-containing protein, partial [Spirochaetaceae bacterium]|nr:GGDEF domain-containing protein [Spirochaetaceae bacterium]